MELSIDQVYNKIAPYFDKTRISIWESVRAFLDAIPSGSTILDNACGNGKNMLYRHTDLHATGIDISEEQVKICLNKHLDVCVASMTCLPFANERFDAIICIAAYHHLKTLAERCQAICEMYRCLRPGGKALVTVFAMEQEPGSRFAFTSSDELVPWTTPDGVVYMRYYHIYKRGELEKEINDFCPAFVIESCKYELGNWVILLTK